MRVASATAERDGEADSVDRRACVRDHDGDAPPATTSMPMVTGFGDMYTGADGVFRMGSMSPSPPSSTFLVCFCPAGFNVRAIGVVRLGARACVPFFFPSLVKVKNPGSLANHFLGCIISAAALLLCISEEVFFSFRIQAVCGEISRFTQWELFEKSCSDTFLVLWNELCLNEKTKEHYTVWGSTN
jgi:hypothetical protein